MEIIAIQKFEHTAPRKLRLVADLVRKMTPQKALVSLRFAHQAASTPLSKAIQSAMANAKQQNLKEEDLVFKSLEINEGPSMKRFHPGSKGRANPYKKRTSHIRVVLSEKEVK